MTAEVVASTANVSDIAFSRQLKPRLFEKAGQFRVFPVGEVNDVSWTTPDDEMEAYLRSLETSQGHRDKHWNESDLGALSYDDSKRALGAFRKASNLTSKHIDDLRSGVDQLKNEQIVTHDSRPLVRHLGAVLAASVY